MYGFVSSWSRLDIQQQRTFENTDRGREIVYSPRGLERSSDDRRGRHKIVCEGVVEVSLWCELSAEPTPGEASLDAGN